MAFRRIHIAFSSYFGTNLIKKNLKATASTGKQAKNSRNIEPDVLKTPGPELFSEGEKARFLERKQK